MQKGIESIIADVVNAIQDGPFTNEQEIIQYFRSRGLFEEGSVIMTINNLQNFIDDLKKYQAGKAGKERK